jgi:hypothetical protein
MPRSARGPKVHVAHRQAGAWMMFVADIAHIFWWRRRNRIAAAIANNRNPAGVNENG